MKMGPTGALFHGVIPAQAAMTPGGVLDGRSELRKPGPQAAPSAARRRVGNAYRTIRAITPAYCLQKPPVL